MTTNMKHLLLVFFSLIVAFTAGQNASFNDTSVNATSNATARQTERTLIMVKPVGVQRGFIGEIIGRFEKKGYKLIALKFTKPSKHLLIEHYRGIKTRPFFPMYLEHLMSGPVVAMVWEGEDVVEVSRVMIGSYPYTRSPPGTIRGDLGVTRDHNVIHGSDNVEDAIWEIPLWFKDEELMKWHSISEHLI